MWKRRDIKREAKGTIKKNYWRMVIVCLIMAIFVGSYSYMSTEIQSNIEPASINFKGMTNSEIVNKLITGFTDRSNETIENSNVFNATRGVFASLFNNITSSSSFLFGILNSVNQFLFHDSVMASIIILIGALLSFLYWLFIGNVLRVGEIRFFLECKLYTNTKVNRMLYIFKIRKIRNVAFIMFLKTIYTILWSFTIVGGIIKGYSYRMVPYILAENPDIGRKEVFRLSRRMMKGQKWRAFLLDMSFFLWELLVIFTFGFAGFLYVNPYKAATNTELYRILRERAITEGYEFAEYLNDIYLTRIPDKDLTQNEQWDTNAGFYPIHLYTIPEYPSRKWISTDYHRDYSISSLILLFFTYAFIGWVWEVMLQLLSSGEFVNRGVLFGPWLPIYGTGGVLVLILLKKWIDKPVTTFFLVVAVCAIVEYFTGWYLESFKGAKWWDYSGYLFHLHGRICLEGLLVFGLGGCASIYLVAPIVDNILNKIPKKIKIALCVVLLLFFTTDMIYSKDNPNQGEGITVSENINDNL